MPQPFLHLFQLLPILLRCGLSLHLETSLRRMPAIVREAKKVERLWLLATSSRVLCGEPSERYSFVLLGSISS